MHIEDYEKILDALQETGVYVIREDDHRILYCNRRVREVAPTAAPGAVCHELWPDRCPNCPLRSIGSRQESRSVCYNSPFGRVVDVAAIRTLWGDGIPAFIVTLTPHIEASSFNCHRLIRANLTRDSYELVRLNRPDDWTAEGLTDTLSGWLDHFLDSGFPHPDDLERLRTFTRLEYLREGMRSSRRGMTCIYRRKHGEEYRWDLVEVSPDFEYTDENQQVLIYAKDVHDVLREGLEREESNIRSQEVIRSLGEKNFSIYVINLDTGLADPVRVDGEMQGPDAPRQIPWDQGLRPGIQDQLHWEYQPEFERLFSLQSLRQALADGEAMVDMLCMRITCDYLYSYISVNAFLSQEPGGRPYAVLAFQDADERVRQELAHSQRDMQMAAILKCRYRMMNTIQLTNGLCDRVDLRQPGDTEPQTGDYAQHIQQALDSFVHPEDAEQYMQVLSLEHIRQRAMETDDYLEEICQYRTCEQPPRWLEQHVVYSRQAGEVLVNILGRDITREKVREAAQREKDLEKSDIIRSLSSMFFATYYANLDQDTFQSVTQLREVGELLGDQVRYTAGLRAYAEAFVHPDDRAEYLSVMSIANLRENLGRHRPYLAVEYRKRPESPDAPPDECGWIRATAVLVRMDGQGRPLTVLYAAQDVTESKQKEAREHRALQEACQAANHASAAKSDFLSRMSHDIRTPMNGIIGMTAIAASHADDPERVMDCLKKITVSSQHLLSLVNGVLDMSQIESGKIDLAEERFSIPEMVGNLAVILRSPIQERNHRLIIHPMEVEHETVLGDAARLQQVFVNILGNSVKYTRPGGLLEIEVRERESRQHGYGCYDFIFRDNGVGMDEAFVQHIFEPFSRAEDSRVSAIEGAGLGMTIAQNIVRRMGGKIAVKSRLGVGSQFTVTLFLKQSVSPEADAPAEESSSGQTVSLQGRRLLLAEDNELNREIACEILDGAGAAVECAQNGQEAVDLFAKREPGYYDLILMDIQMPVLDGCGAARAIRALPRPDSGAIPIIAMSANAFAEDISASQEAGMNEHITKPLDIPRLMSSLGRWLNC